MVEEPKETVILVHGTFAAPRRGKTQWYQPCDDASANGFIARLNAALERRGSAARCWAHRSGEDSGFHWSGENSWIARTHAATALAAYVANLREKGWRCHIVAHSHGGNVVCEALPQIVTAQEPSSPLGNIVTLGTPFMDVMSAILQRAQLKARILETSTRMSSALFTLMFLIYIISSIVLSVLIGGVYGLVLFGILGVINSSRIGRLISNLERLLGSGSTEEKTKSDDAQALYSVLALAGC